MQKNTAYYAIIPAEVRYDPDLPPNAKLLYGEITALSHETGCCWASNRYFAELYGASIRSVKNWIGALSEKGYIQIKLIYREGSKEVESRFITITGSEKNFTTPGKKFHEGSEKNFTTPGEKNFPDNNTSINNTSINKKERAATASYDSILSTIADDGLRNLYLEYIKMRKLIKAPLTDAALQIIISDVIRLEPHSIDRQKRILQNAIKNNWKSVYPLKDEPVQTASSPGFDLDEFFEASVNHWQEESYPSVDED